MPEPQHEGSQTLSGAWHGELSQPWLLAHQENPALLASRQPTLLNLPIPKLVTDCLATKILAFRDALAEEALALALAELRR
ncbi:hypothetical protein TIFTF001_053987 [Ficus carica]|uniref:Uncharacterized protein n=1 Tax=Ficus carica TaxID=3494 RepID=A0AA88EG84_FICCA|nr:hypothetical protein TIFTF001_053987 [Ficus carica]